MERVHSKSGKYIALLPDAEERAKGIRGFSVVVTANGVGSFISSWPCSRLHEYPIRFDYAENGDLVDIIGNQPDGEDLLALSQDAQEWGEKILAKQLLPPKPLKGPLAFWAIV